MSVAGIPTGRHGELAGHLAGYPSELVARAIWQTADLHRRHPGAAAYLLIPDEANAPLDLVTLTYDVDRQQEACLTPWRFEILEATAYCLHPEGHDTDTDGDLLHGWYTLIDGIERGEEAMHSAADRIAERAREALRRHQA